MEKLVKKEQCIAALTAAGISEESAKKINDIQDDAADCIYRYAMTSAFFACDEIVDLCINAVQEQTEYPSKNILYIIQVLANAKLNPDVISQFIMSHIHSRFDDLRREAYALIRTNTCTSVEETLTADKVQDIVSDAFINIMNAISSLNGKVQDIADNMENTDDENNDAYSELITQISTLQAKIDERESEIRKLNDELAVLKEKQEKNNCLSHSNLVKIASTAKKKKHGISANLVKACRTGKMSTDDAIFFLENTSDEEFEEIVKMYLE